ncbi:MAG: FAD-linked oxidase C-terminal domain-containing protein, partial [Candidatus Korobacteraceae bacterium]
RQTRTFVAQFTTWMDALKFRDLVLHSPLSPMCLELVSPNASQLMRLEAKSESWKICVRASGSDVVLARYRKELGSAVTRELQAEEEKEMWRKIENCGYVSRLDIMVPSSGVADVLESLEEVRRRLFEFAVLGRVGIGHVQVHTGFGEFGGPNPAQALIDHLRQQAKCEISFCMGGSTSSWPVTPSGLSSMRAVKTALDPKDILNRGRFPF